MKKRRAYRVEEVPWNSTLWKSALEIRMAVFVVEQHVPAEEEVDAIDEVAHHVLAFDGEAAIATGRLFTAPEDATLGKIGRMAVLESHRGSGAGSAIMDALLVEAKRRGYRTVALSAQLHAIPFYERHGFEAYGGVYDDAGIPHRMMKKGL
ncbi:MAG TPA: GNAT family N-acetyltransferase [Candidatus Sumerlaeota bacterium]|nr:GNAT family N-acetyltransferase [Candidatus Sumerlaeota bacterium]